MPFHQLWIYMVGKKQSDKADQSTLASGGSEYAWLFSVAISWGNKMNFQFVCEHVEFLLTVTINNLLHEKSSVYIVVANYIGLLHDYNLLLP